MCHRIVGVVILCRQTWVQACAIGDHTGPLSSRISGIELLVGACPLDRFDAFDWWLTQRLCGCNPSHVHEDLCILRTPRSLRSTPTLHIVVAAMLAEELDAPAFDLDLARKPPVGLLRPRNLGLALAQPGKQLLNWRLRAPELPGCIASWEWWWWW